MLSHEYHVYETTAGSVGISPVHWYGKEGAYEVIVLENVGISLGNLISAQPFNHWKIFFASQMVGSLLYVHVQRFTELIHSSQLLNHFIPDTTSTVTSNREMS